MSSIKNWNSKGSSFSTFSSFKGINLICLVSIGIALSLQSCSSKETEGLISESPTGTTISVNVYNSPETSDARKLAAYSNAKATTSTGSTSTSFGRETMVSGADFDAMLSTEISLNSDGKGENDIAKITVRGSQASKVDNFATLDPSKKYRILVYNADGTTLLKNITANSGTNPNISVDAEKRYKWVAFSVNETSVPDVQNGKLIAGDLLNKDILYSSGYLDAKNGENYLNIAFQRKATRIDVDIDTRGLFGPINTFASMLLGTHNGQFKSLVNTADLDLLTGDFGPVQPVPANKTVINISNRDFASTKDLVKTVSIYTIIPNGTVIEANTLSIQPIFTTKLDRTVALPPSIVEVDTRGYGKTNSYLTFKNDAFVPVSGNRYRLSIRMIESPVIVRGVSWARSDLWYDGTVGQIDPYRFKVDAGVSPYTSANQNEYWNWMATTPTGRTGSGDPCALVYPADTWRTPTKKELNTLCNISAYEYYGFPLVKKISSKRFADTYNWYAVVNQSWNSDKGTFQGSGTYSGYNDKLLLTFNGFRQCGIINNSRTVVDSRKRNSFCTTVTMGYWTNDDCGNAATCITQNATVNYISGYNYTISYLKRNIKATAKSNGLNVRCVRK